MPIITVPVTFTAYDQNGAPVAGARVLAKLDRTETYQGFVAPEQVEATTDVNGVAILDLWPNELGVAGSSYRVRAWNPDTGAKFLDALAVVPNSACAMDQIIVVEPYPLVDAAQAAVITAQAAAATATAQAGTATTQAGIATTQAGIATTQAGIATTQAGTATTQAGTATTQAGIATTKAGEALASANAAAASESAVAGAIVAERTATATLTNKTLTSPTFTGTPTGITKTHVGLGNVDNTADTAKPVSTAQQTALDLKANLASPTFTGTVSGITKAMVGLGSADNTSDADKPVSTAQQTALNLKANLASPALTGTPTAPTAAPGTNTTQLATTAHVFAERTATATLTNKTLTSPTLTTEAVAVTTNNLPAIRPTLLLDFGNSQHVDSRITFTRASTATRVNAQGLIESVASGVPRIDFDPVTGACKGLLIEAAATNLLTYSEQFDNAAWVKVRSGVNANAIVAPDGTLTAEKLVEDTTNNTHATYPAVYTATNTTVTASIFVKAAGRSSVVLTLSNFATGGAAVRFNLLTGVASGMTDGGDFTGATASCTALGNGWYRCALTATKGAVNSNVYMVVDIDNGTTNSYTGDGISGLYIWGAQLEVGSTPTSYIPTAASAVTRAADVAVMTGTNFSSWYRQDEGAFVVTASVSAIDMAATQEHYLVAASDGSSANFIALRGYSNAGYLLVDALVAASSVTQVDTANVAFLPGSVFTAAVAFKTNDVASSVNASTPSTDSSVVIPTVSALYVGGQPSGAARKNAHIRSLAYYPKRVTNSELQALSTP